MGCCYDDAGHILGIHDGSGALTEEIVWLGDTPIATLRPQSGGGVRAYNIHTDHLNTPRVVTDSVTAVVRWRWDGDPFGGGAVNDDPSGAGVFEFSLRFPGQVAMAETGLHYNYFRDYDPRVGRYLKSDPMSVGEHVRRRSALRQIALSHDQLPWPNPEAAARSVALSELPAELSSYVYVANDPLRWVDPTGESGWIGFGIVVGGTIGGFYCYKKGIERCEEAFPHYRDLLHPDRRKFLSCISSVTGVIALGMGWTTDPIGAAATEAGAQTCGDQCK